MYDVIKSIINYTGTYFDKVDQYILYASISVIVVLTVVGVDLIYKLFLSIFGRR